MGVVNNAQQRVRRVIFSGDSTVYGTNPNHAENYLSPDALRRSLETLTDHHADDTEHGRYVRVAQMQPRSVD